MRGNPTQADDRCAADSLLCRPLRVPAAARALLTPPACRPHPAPLPPRARRRAACRPRRESPVSRPQRPRPPRRAPFPTGGRAAHPSPPSRRTCPACRVPRLEPEHAPQAERLPPPGNRAVFTAVRPRHRARPRRPRPAETHPARRVAACPLGESPPARSAFGLCSAEVCRGGGGIKSL